MADERGVKIKIGGEDHELILTVFATKEIAKRYGGIENLGDKLLNEENLELAFDEIVWLIGLLANQEILIYNLRHTDKPKPLITEREIELLTSPFDLGSFKDAILEAMHRGAVRNIESEDEGAKNSPAG